MAGYVMNGFSYPANRWRWAYALLIGYMTVTAAQEMTRQEMATLRSRNKDFPITATRLRCLKPIEV